MRKYLKVWWLYTINSFQVQLNVRWAFVLFIFAKILRFAAFIFFLVVLVKSTKVLAGYNLDQVILFFLSFNLLDILSQLIFREVYRFRAVILSGNFDYYLMKPLNPLFRSLFTGADLFDFATLIPLIFALLYFINKLQLLDIIHLSSYFLMLLVGLVIALSFHIFVLSLGIFTTEVDNAVFVYRDLMGMGRVPVDIYMEPIRGLVTFIIPVGIMMTFPAKSLMGLLSLSSLVYSILFAAFLFYLSLNIWKIALRNYSSASS
ncbi:ABC-2 family transporter protein [Candidatus Daviesbacteria bacterium]|nr:ABC-2 family transporter protein [Candidatus Daviesbacteria bacterium]MBI4038643.1 ABC-2 family transporter protein [Candidatus Daviesbacteria bacterium]